MTRPSWVALHCRAYSFIELCRPLRHDKAVIHEGVNCKEDRTPKNWCLWTVVLEKTSESPLDSKEIKSVINLKGNQPWILVGRTDAAEAEAPVFWSSDLNSLLIGRVSDAGKDWGLEKRVSEDEMAGWHHQCNGPEFGQTLGDGEGQGGLACCSPWGHQESYMTGWLNNRQKASRRGKQRETEVVIEAGGTQARAPKGVRVLPLLKTKVFKQL